MAEENKKRSYPKIAKGNWFGLREKFKQKVPVEVSPSYLAAAMNMSPASASSNVIAPLRTFGIVDDGGKPTDLAFDWRDDAKYPEVCATILQKTYPQELRDLFHTPDADPNRITSWFARDGKVGEPAARMYASTYLMLLEANLENGKGSATPKTKPASKTSPSPNRAASAKRSKTPAEAPASSPVDVAPPSQQPAEGQKSHTFSPKLHIDVQIHISPESSPEQIDKIFESMAKHLKDFRS